jgi:phosphate acetyltransferase
MASAEGTMLRNLYITAMGPHSGKSIVALGLMELLSTKVARLGYFRPIIPGGGERDSQIELFRSRYGLAASYAEMHALTEDEARDISDYAELRKHVVAAYKALEQGCDFIVCEGTDFTRPTPGLDFGRNADLANELGAPVLVVVDGGPAEQTAASARVARDSLLHKGCAVFGVLVNRAPAELAARIAAALSEQAEGDPVYVLPEDPELACPTVGDVAAAIDGKLLGPAADVLDRDVRAVVVAAMSVENFVADLAEDTLVVASADRPDVLVAALASAATSAIPTVAGVVVSGGYPVSPIMRALLYSAPFAVFEAVQPTHVIATAAATVQPVLRAQDERKIARALGLFESAVDTAELGRRISLDRPARVTPIMFEYELIERAKAARKHIVLPEGNDDRVLRAAEILLRRGVVDVTILANAEELHARAAALGVELAGADVVDPLTSPLREKYAARYFELRKHKGMTEERAFDAVGDAVWFGTMMTEAGAADGMVSGAAHTTADTIRPSFQVIGARDGVAVVSSVFFMCLSDRVLVYGDCAVNPKPDFAQLADIAINSAATAMAFGIEPRIAMLSYSTGESGTGPDVEAVAKATAAVRAQRPDLKVEGPIQYDAAVDVAVARMKLPDSEVAGHATVFIFPDLDTGNVAYKAVQRSANAVAIGPVLQGLRKPVNDLSRGCTVTDIVNTVAITAVQAQDAG